MTGVGPGERPVRAPVVGDHGRGDHIGPHALQQPVEHHEDLARVVLREREPGDGVAELGHRGGGGQAVPGDVADGEQHLFVAHVDRLVPVAAERLHLRGQVADRHLQIGLGERLVLDGHDDVLQLGGEL